MASKRDLKKAVKYMVYDVMDECDYAVVNSEKGNANAEKLMDEAVNFYEDVIAKINSAKTAAEFKSVKATIDGKYAFFTEGLNEIN